MRKANSLTINLHMQQSQTKAVELQYKRTQTTKIQHKIQEEFQAW